MREAATTAIWEQHFEEFLKRQEVPGARPDSSHGLEHVRRVVHVARSIGAAEGARLEVVVPAAWLHDCVSVEKDSPDRPLASTFAADAARAFLAASAYPPEWLDDIHHAIRAHSFSAGVSPETLEAKVVQDADRLDALGAIGLSRCLMVGERLGRALYDPDDPFCRQRTPDDARSAIDHFYTKLLTLPATMQTRAGVIEARRRAEFLRSFLAQLETELEAFGGRVGPT